MSTTTRTTIALDTGLLRTAKDRAKREDCTLGQYIARSLQRTIPEDDARTPEPEPVYLPTVSGGVPNPAIDWSSNASIQEFLDAEDLKQGRLPRW